ncbi:MAG: hypothetical protein IKF64_06660 [Eubacterium sp.]|nr:hypothetical protein [Eubacterium sp.]
MDGFFDYTRKIKDFASYPTIFASVLLLLVYFAELFGIMQTDKSDYVSVLFGVCFCAITVYYSCNSMKKAVASCAALLCCDLAVFAFVGAHLSLLTLVVIASVFVLIMMKTELFYGFVCCALAAVAIALIVSLIYERYIDLLKAFADRIQGRGAVFGALSNPFNLIFGSSFDKLFYHGYYSSTSLQGGKFATGAIDIFSASASPQVSVSQFLTGRYFASAIIPIGVFVALFKHLDKEILFAFIASLLLSVVTGDERLFYLLVLFVSPLIYVGSMLIVFVSYAVCSFVDIRIGFLSRPSLAELITNMDKPVYFLLTGIICIVLAFFFTRLIAAKFNLFQSENVPRNLRPLVSSLGGRDNIVRIKNGSVVVRNPNLIDVIRLDCEISENTVVLSRELTEKLRDITD